MLPRQARHKHRLNSKIGTVVYIYAGAMTWYNPDPKDYNNSLRNGFLAQLDEDSTVLGWGCDWTDETGCVSVASSHGVLTEASQSDYSLLTIGGYHHHSHFPFAQKSRPQRRAPTPTPTPAVHTVTFVLSDGDNVHWCAQRQRCFGTSFLRTGMNDSRLPRQARDRHREGTFQTKCLRLIAGCTTAGSLRSGRRSFGARFLSQSASILQKGTSANVRTTQMPRVIAMAPRGNVWSPLCVTQARTRS
jgi:hypothetical protein